MVVTCFWLKESREMISVRVDTGWLNDILDLRSGTPSYEMLRGCPQSPQGPETDLVSVLAPKIVSSSELPLRGNSDAMMATPRQCLFYDDILY